MHAQSVRTCALQWGQPNCPLWLLWIMGRAHYLTNRYETFLCAYVSPMLGTEGLHPCTVCELLHLRLSLLAQHGRLSEESLRMLAPAVATATSLHLICAHVSQVGSAYAEGHAHANLRKAPRWQRLSFALSRHQPRQYSSIRWQYVTLVASVMISCRGAGHSQAASHLLQRVTG